MLELLGLVVKEDENISSRRGEKDQRLPSLFDFPKEALTNLKSESEVILSRPTLCDPMNCSLSGSSVHGIFQARILECVAISSSRGSSQPSLLHLLHWQADSLPLCHLGITLHIYNKILLFIAWHTNRRNLNTNKFSVFRGGRSVREC